MKNLKYLILFSVLSFASLTSCNMKNKYGEEEQAKISEYIANNPNLHFQLKPSGLYYLDVVTGTGPQAETHDTACVFYDIKLLDGTIFETNFNSTDTLKVLVNEWKLAVKGFDEGITYMKEGGQALFLVPSSLAFGDVGISTIGGYTPLLMDANLVKLKKPLR